MALNQFETVFTQLIQDLSDYCKQYGIPETALKWFQDVSNCGPYSSINVPSKPLPETDMAEKKPKVTQI